MNHNIAPSNDTICSNTIVEIQIEEFEESWNEVVIQKHDDSINESLIEPTVESTVELTGNTVLDAERVKLLEKATKIIDEFKSHGINIQGITPEMIIENWSDMLLLKNSNSNRSYLNKIIESTLEYGFDYPRPIQSVTIGKLIYGGDLIVQAVAGNGKTGAFVIGAISKIDPRLKEPQVLILLPTQLLAEQTFKIVKDMYKNIGITIECFHGGSKTFGNLHSQVIIGCPGRINNILLRNQEMTNSRYKFNFDFVKTLIFDEADELLNSEFILQIDTIVKSIPETAQICLFSATYSKKILETCSRFMKDPAYVILPEYKSITDLVTNWYLKCDENSKNSCVYNLIKKHKDDTIIVFFNNCSKLTRFSDFLNENNIEHSCVNSKMDVTQREVSFSKFIKNETKILLASDIAARGLDIPRVNLIINYDIPKQFDVYVHRTGRAGRSHKIGNSITLTKDNEHKTLKFECEIRGSSIKEYTI